MKGKEIAAQKQKLQEKVAQMSANDKGVSLQFSKSHSVQFLRRLLVSASKD